MALGAAVFGTATLLYAVEAVPKIPNWPQALKRHFGRKNNWLIDGRVACKVGIKEYLRLMMGFTCLVNALHDGSNPFVPSEPQWTKSGIRWMIGQAGSRYRDISAEEGLGKFKLIETGMDWVEGCGAYALEPTDFNNCCVYLTGSVGCGVSELVLSIGRCDGTLGLRFHHRGTAHINHGCASRGIG